MKKMLVMALVMALLLPVFAKAEEELHLLWDIPFGITMEECKQALSEKGVLVSAEDEITLVSDENQELMLFGFPVRLRAMVDSNHGLSDFSFSFQGIEEMSGNTDDTVTGCVLLYAQVYGNLVEKYGEPTGGRFSVISSSTGRKKYNFPLEQNQIHQEILADALTVYENVIISAYFHNIHFNLIGAKDRAPAVAIV